MNQKNFASFSFRREKTTKFCSEESTPMVTMHYCVLADVSRTAPREGPHAYVAIVVAPPSDDPIHSVTPSAAKQEKPDESLKQPVKYCRCCGSPWATFCSALRRGSLGGEAFN